MVKGIIGFAAAVAVINAGILWCCCAINRQRSLSSSLATHAAPCIADTWEPDEKGKIANGCECQNTER